MGSSWIQVRSVGPVGVRHTCDAKLGIVTPSIKDALLVAEARQVQARADLEAIERFEPSQILPRAKEIHQQMAVSLENYQRCGCGP